MKYLVKFFVVTWMLILCTHALAEQKIVYIDMKYILNQSTAGKKAQDFLKKSFESAQSKFSKTEKELKAEETDLLGKKTTLSKEDYKKKADTLRKKVIKFQTERRKALDKISKLRITSRQALLKQLDPILTSYIDENNISFMLDKKNILAGTNAFDATDIITEKLNKELPSLNLN